MQNLHEVMRRLRWRVTGLAPALTAPPARHFVATVAAQADITALSLALAPEVARNGRPIALPASLHAPLRQRMVLLKSAAREVF